MGREGKGWEDERLGLSHIKVKGHMEKQETEMKWKLETETGNGNWKWKLETGTKDALITGAMFAS